MFLGALVHLGVDLAQIERKVKAFGIRGFKLGRSRVRRAGIAGVRLRVKVAREKSHSYARIKKILARGKSSPWVKDRALAVFENLARAEGAVHGLGLHAGHFHEVGALDALVDVIGSLAAVESLAVDKILSSPLVLGSGTVKAAHGVLPVPAPATLALLKGSPVFQRESGCELTTPTGAALVTGLAEGFGPLPPLRLLKTGYGAGARAVPGVANMFRLILGQSDDACGHDRVIVMETNIDDMTPLAYEPLFETLFAAGALDVFLEPITMKRGRPAVKLSLIAPPPLENRLARALLEGTTTFGLRCYQATRWLKQRTQISVATRYGRVGVKMGTLDGKLTDLSPEYADCRRLAKKAGVSFLEVYEEAKKRAKASGRKRKG